MKAILQPFSAQRLRDVLKASLKGQDKDWHSFQAAIAFAKRSGVQHIEDELRGFAEQGGYVRMIVGIDQYGTSIEGLLGLLAAVGNKGEVWINHDSNNYVTFHPKVYLFEEKTVALLIVGSGNLTQGGLYTNDEASLIYELDLSNSDDQVLLSEIKEALDNWCNKELENVRQLDEALLRELIEADYIRSEEKSRTEDEAEEDVTHKSEKSDVMKSSEPKKMIFGRGLTRKAPPKRRKDITHKKQKSPKPIKDSQVISSNKSIFVTNRFVLTILYGDLPQKGSSNEIRLAKGIRDINPSFWGWPDKFNGPDDKGQYH